MSSSQRWLDELAADLEQRSAAHLRRRLIPTSHNEPNILPSDEQDVNSGHGPSARLIRRDGRTLLNFASNDYLALAQHPRLIDAAVDATRRFGTGTGASRLVTGHLTIHDEVERKFAAFKHAQAALLCPTGYMANLAVLTTLAGPGDLICIDKLCHASLIDAALASGANVRSFPHKDAGKLQKLLSDPKKMRPAMNTPVGRAPRRFIVTDSVFSMDGDCADLPALCDLARSHEAIVIVDEAHGTGILGESAAGLCEAQGVGDRVDVVISTASKALGGLGGIITAKQVVIETLVNHARSFIFTTGIPAAQAAAIGAAIDVFREEPWRRQRVLALSNHVRSMLDALESPLLKTIAADDQNHITPIIPIITGSSELALKLAAHLAEHGIHAPAIRPPTVPRNAARIRLSLRADMTEEDVARLRHALVSAPC